MLKSFKSFLTESVDINSINQIFRKYINGSMPDPYNNQESDPKILFQQVYDIFTDNNINLIILNHKDKKFNGSNIVINIMKPYHFKLQDKEGNILPYNLHAELKKKDDEDIYFFSALKIEK